MIGLSLVLFQQFTGQQNILSFASTIFHSGGFRSTAGISAVSLCQSLCNSDLHYVFGQDWQETPAHQWMLHHGVVSDQHRTPQWRV